jgi:hypothetical protein
MSSHDDTARESFAPLAGLQRVFQPTRRGATQPKKHRCSDCHYCQMCSDARCHACRDRNARCGAAAPRRLSLREQIALFEAVNRADRPQTPAGSAP